MIGPQADLFSLNPAEHSIGLVKNFQITSEPNYLELTQGVKNNIVYSVMTSNPVKATMEVYEYTSKNLSYGLGLDGSSLQAKTAATLKTAITGDGIIDDVVINAATDNSAQFPAGSYITLQKGGTDVVHVSRVVSATYAAGTSDTTIVIEHPIPTGMNFGAGDKVTSNNVVDVGSKAEQPYLSAKIIGILPDGNKPFAILMPKLRISRGFTLAFQTDNFGNLPFEFTPYELVATDPFYGDFDGVAKLVSAT